MRETTYNMQKGPWSVVPFVCLLLDSPQRCQAPEAVWTLPYLLYGAQVLISSKKKYGVHVQKREQAESLELGLKHGLQSTSFHARGSLTSAVDLLLTSYFSQNVPAGSRV